MVDDGRTDDGRRTTDGRTDGRTPEHGHPISSPCEPDGSGELKTTPNTPKIESGLTQLIMMGESIHQIRVNVTSPHMSHNMGKPVFGVSNQV